jgi:hypothetical protein
MQITDQQSTQEQPATTSSSKYRQLKEDLRLLQKKILRLPVGDSNSKGSSWLPSSGPGRHGANFPQCLTDALVEACSPSC